MVDTYLKRIANKIEKLTTRLFHVTPEERVALLRRIQKLKIRHKDYQLTKAQVRVPEELFRRRVKSIL